ncbi:leucine-rich repeat protein 1-like isoform X1 [Artemia franciscana]|uniref:leucine-rich repeat protein 1-like isoform X1 n=1 Tax=Artemia franciscana TaxID=6661 RepID=UPI0032DB6058
MIVLQIHFEKFNKNFIGHSATKKCRVSFEKQDGAMYFIAEIVKPDGTFGCKHEFKINGNVSQMFYTFINDGKTTIRFKIPDICLSLRGKPEQVAKITVAIAKLSGLKDDAKKIMEETKLVLPSPDAQKDAQKSTKTKSSLTDLPPSKKPKVELEKLKLEIRSHKEFIQVSHLPLTLTTLKIGNVQFSRLDQRCLRLVNLQWLTVNNTQLETLPESMDIFPNLCVLDLGNNYISDLPRMFFRTLSPNLTVLNLSKNKLTYLSEDISKLKNLKALYVRHNQLTRIPWKIGLLPNLRLVLILLVCICPISIP